MTLATAGLLFALLGIFCAYGFSSLFPQVEVSLYDWHVRAQSPTSIDPSIVVVTVDEHSPASCGNEGWNSSTIAKMISALDRAGASVIAPAISFQVPNPSECGDVLGNAQLLEATKQAGKVVYPSFAQPMIATEARATGWFMLSADKDGIFRGLSEKQRSQDLNHLPFGLAIASAYNNDRSLHLPEQGLITFAGRWADQPFPTYTFKKLFDLVQQGEDVKLANLIRDKIVFIFPITQNSTRLDTPLETDVSLGFLHANLLNASLTNSWVQKPSWESWLLRTLALAVTLAIFSLWRRDMWGWLGVGIILLASFGLNIMSFFSIGSVWPYLSSTIAIVCTLVGTTVWPLYEERKRVRNQIKKVSTQLYDTQETLAKKELVVDQLEEELLEVKEQAQETAQKFDSLSTTEDETLSLLREAEVQAANARQQLETLQKDLRHLQKSSPVLPQEIHQSSDAHQQQLQQETESFGIRTCSPVLLQTFQELKKTARTDNPILIFGETGTGKELFAEAAHRLSNRAQGPFVSINMAAIRPELFESELFGHVKGAFTGAISRRGFFETADRGSVFLDEIGELPLDLQAKLLRVLENGEFYRVGQSSPTHVDVRIIAATNRDLSQAVNDGQYREDLYYRLRSLVFTLPPLRERGTEDLTLLVQHILSDLSSDRTPVQCTQGAIEAIHAYAWPGNVRELRQSLSQAVALIDGDILAEHDLRLPTRENSGTRVAPTMSNVDEQTIAGKEEIARREDVFVLSTLRKHGFDMQATAKALEWDRSTVTQRLKGLGFQALVDHEGDQRSAIVSLAGSASHEKIVKLKLDGYYRNLLSSTTPYKTAEEAIANCRKRMRNIPERHFPAIETLIRWHYSV